MSTRSGALVGILWLLTISGASSQASSLDQDRLDMNAADSAQNAPYFVDSRFVVSAAAWCAQTISSSQAALRVSKRPEVRRIAMDAVATCKRVALQLASIERRKGWTLPPPDSFLYGRMSIEPSSDSDYISSQADHDRAAISLFNQELQVGRDKSVKALAQQQMTVLRRELQSIEDLPWS